MQVFRFLALLFVFAFPAQAQEKDVQSVISGQFSAFLLDDFETAFSFAAPSIRRVFQTSERFGQMVSQGYPMVHRPADYVFQDLVSSDDKVFQNVLIEDDTGAFYMARYTLILTEMGWKISAVEVLRAPGVGV